jgi:hypothetical protein
MPHLPRTPNIAEEMDAAYAELLRWKTALLYTSKTDYERQIECRLQIGKATQRIRNLRREMQEGRIPCSE